MVDTSTIIEIAAIGASLLTVIIEHFHYTAGLQERIMGVETNVTNIQKSIDRVMCATEDIIQLKTKVDLFWGALESELPGMLLKGNPIKSDSEVAVLLSKFNENKLEDNELEKLISLLEQETRNPEHKPGELLVMILLCATLRSKIKSQPTSEVSHDCTARNV